MIGGLWFLTFVCDYCNKHFQSWSDSNEGVIYIEIEEKVGRILQVNGLAWCEHNGVPLQLFAHSLYNNGCDDKLSPKKVSNSFVFFPLSSLYSPTFKYVVVFI